jgi:hypothetical protein
VSRAPWPRPPPKSGKDLVDLGTERGELGPDFGAQLSRLVERRLESPLRNACQILEQDQGAVRALDRLERGRAPEPNETPDLTRP